VSHIELEVVQEEACSLTAKDFKADVKPIWCPGCGDYGVLASLTKAFAGMGRPPEQVVTVSGIGCSSRLPAYLSTYGFHGVHGRALPMATGLKVSRPDLTVVVVGGDGDGFSIGGNHFLHACRRNVDLTYVVMDNRVYGMTKGQPSPTTEGAWKAALAPEGTGLDPFDPLEIALSAGATFLARGFSGDPKGGSAILEAAIRHPGFAFVQFLSPCVTFRPEQRQWRDDVDRGALAPASTRDEAWRRLREAPGLATGVLYRGERASFVPPLAEVTAEVESFARELERHPAAFAAE
jgi:2-oxoglutarate ferredoxin oxidoreductase subunit beta